MEEDQTNSKKMYIQKQFQRAKTILEGNNINNSLSENIDNNNNYSRKFNSFSINENPNDDHSEVVKKNPFIKRMITKDGNFLTTKAEKIISKLLNLKNKALIRKDTEDVANLDW